MTLFAQALNHLGQYLLDQFDGSFVKLIQSARHSAEKLVGLLSKMPFFNDVQRYRDRDVPLYKRAQLTAADIGFAVGPRLNAAGRLEDMALGIECLLCDDPVRARELAAVLDYNDTDPIRG